MLKVESGSLPKFNICGLLFPGKRRVPKSPIIQKPSVVYSSTKSIQIVPKWLAVDSSGLLCTAILHLATEENWLLTSALHFSKLGPAVTQLQVYRLVPQKLVNPASAATNAWL